MPVQPVDAAAFGTESYPTDALGSWLRFCGAVLPSAPERLLRLISRGGGSGMWSSCDLVTLAGTGTGLRDGCSGAVLSSERCTM